MNQPDSLNDLDASTVLSEFNQQRFDDRDNFMETVRLTVFHNDEETRSLRVEERTYENGTVQTEVELADTSGESTTVLDVSRTFF